jgi:hypothetical protein
LLDVVELLRDVPAEGLHRGQQGTVVDLLESSGAGLLVEFANGDGEMIALATLAPNDVRTIWRLKVPTG